MQTFELKQIYAGFLLFVDIRLSTEDLVLKREGFWVQLPNLTLPH